MVHNFLEGTQEFASRQNALSSFLPYQSTPSLILKTGTILDILGNIADYESIVEKVGQWWRPDLRTDPKNVRIKGCVAFVSTAMRKAGISIPTLITTQTTFDDLMKIRSPSLLLEGFVGYLSNTYPWMNSMELSLLKPGDLVFTYSMNFRRIDHVMIFQSWDQQSKKQAIVIDNQGFCYKRDFFPDTDSVFSAFRYFVRPRLT